MIKLTKAQRIKVYFSFQFFFILFYFFHFVREYSIYTRRRPRRISRVRYPYTIYSYSIILGLRGPRENGPEKNKYRTMHFIILLYLTREILQHLPNTYIQAFFASSPKQNRPTGINKKKKIRHYNFNVVRLSNETRGDKKKQ